LTLLISVGWAVARCTSQKAHDESERLQRQQSLLLSMATLMRTQFRQQSANERARFWKSVRAVAVGVLIPLLLCWMTGFSSVTHHLRLMQQSLKQFNQQHTVFLPSNTDHFKNYAVGLLSFAPSVCPHRKHQGFESGLRGPCEPPVGCLSSLS
jgi:xanthine/uracil permease